MAEEYFDPIILRYEGLDADRNFVDLGQLGASIQGASRIIAAGGNIALTGRFSKIDASAGVRVLTGAPRAGSYELPVYLAAIAMPLTPFLPLINEVAKSAATKVVEATVNAVIAKWAGRVVEAKAASEASITALQEMGHTSRDAIAAMERVCLSHHTAARQVVAPIGISAAVIQFGRIENGAFEIGQTDRVMIEQKADRQVEPERSWFIKITELDLVKRTCKISVIGDQDESRRIAGEITDPAVQMPNNAYSSAFDAQRPIRVRAKASVKAGEIERLFISDTDSPESSAA